MFKRHILFLASLCMVSGSIFAQQPTQAQIQMFQNLPAAQQKALAKQYGYTLPSTSNSSQNDQQLTNPTILTPRTQTQASEPLAKPNMSQDKKETPPELKRFGLDLFAASPSTFAPVSDAPIPSNYRVGPGDEIVVQLFGKDNDTYRLTVNRQGVVNFPSLGPISVSGMSFSQVKHSLTQRINEQIIGVRSDITLGELRTMQIFVMGDAYKPGAYTVSALTTISQALYYSGGFSHSGALRDIQLKRNGKIIRHLDLYNLLLNGDSSNDVRLMPEDVVLVKPVKNTVKVQGEVTRPAIYEVTQGETFQELIHNAGGFTSNAYTDQIQVTRLTPAGDRKILTLTNSSASLNQKVQRGDEITVNLASDNYQNYVKIDGDIVHPGYIEWHHDLHISDVFHSLTSSFNPTADVNYAVVVREINPQHNIRVYQFSLANALLHPESADNLKLQSHDQILVFNRFGGDDLKQTSESDNTDTTGKHTKQTATVAKSFSQAQQQANDEKEHDKKVASGENTLDTKDVSIEQTKWLFQGKKVTKDQIKLLKQNTRRALLAQVLLKLRQQSVYGHPAQIVEVSGEVKHPGLYPITQHDNIKDMVDAAGGLTQYAYIQHAEIARKVTNDHRSNTHIIQFNLNNALLGDAQDNLALAPNDRINILEQPGIKEQNTVVLRGEVRFPGTYTVSKGETLGELLKRAGGLTNYAYPQGAIFTRESLRLKEQKLLEGYADDMRKEVATKSLSADSKQASTVMTDPDKTLAFIKEATNTKALGRLVIQLNKIEEGNLRADLMLEDGDFLYVPTYSNTISIMGEVQVGITYLLDPRLSIDDYIEKAGGMKRQADEDRIFIVHANGSVTKPHNGFWFGRNSESLVAGDTIVVPVDTNYRDALSIWTAATQILYQTGVAVNALK